MTREMEMSATSEDHVPLTDTDVDGLVWQFLNSDYSTDHYANWPLDRRFDGFLRHRGLDRVADNGDMCSILVGRVMTYFGEAGRLAR